MMVFRYYPTAMFMCFITMLWWSPLINASPLFEDDQVLNVELTGPLNRLIENGPGPDELIFILRTGGVDHQIEVRLRGKSRLRVCHFPPIRLNFQDGENKQSVFAGQDKLKLVTHCRNSDSSENNVLDEYLAYRIFSLISDAAYRVRLLHITYSDSEQPANENAGQRYGFVIEPITQLAERTGGVPLSVSGVALKQLNSEQAALVYVFQYMIGNTDWSFVTADGDDECCHNGDLIGVDEDIYYIPYDFDLAGIVDASYAKPDPSMRLRSVRKRKYRGFCTDTSTLRNAIQTINSFRPKILELVRDTPGFSEKDRKKAEEYLAGFFKKSGKPEKLLHSFESQCID